MPYVFVLSDDEPVLNPNVARMLSDCFQRLQYRTAPTTSNLNKVVRIALEQMHWVSSVGKFAIVYSIPSYHSLK